MKETFSKKIKFLYIKIFNLSTTRTIVFGFVCLIFIGAVLLALPVCSQSGESIGFTNALFTATSAVCVTGLVVADTNTYWNLFGKIIILILIQIGALGIMSVVTLFSIVTGKRLGLKERLTIQESLSNFTLSDIVKTFRRILFATIIIELTGAIFVSFRLIPIYGFKTGIAKSLFHSVSAFCNAGFDLFGTNENKFSSLSNFCTDPIILIVTSLLIIIGGLGFIVWEDVVAKKKFTLFNLHTKLVLLLTFILIVSGTIATFGFEFNNTFTLKEMPFSSKLLNSFFHSVTSRTAGFNTLSLDGMTDSTKLFTLILMFIGAAPGSTGGGVKITTIAIIILTVTTFIKGQEDIQIMRERVPQNIIIKSISIVALSFAIILLTTTVLLVNKEGTFIQVLFESVSAFGTVGLSTGITPGLGTFSKYQIILTMLLGRIGPFSAVMAFSLKQKKRNVPYKYAEGKITVG